LIAAFNVLLYHKTSSYSVFTNNKLDGLMKIKCLFLAFIVMSAFGMLSGMESDSSVADLSRLSAEIRFEICKHLITGHSEKQDAIALTNLASTCKSFRQTFFDPKITQMFDEKYGPFALHKTTCVDLVPLWELALDLPTPARKKYIRPLLKNNDTLNNLFWFACANGSKGFIQKLIVQKNLNVNFEIVMLRWSPLMATISNHNLPALKALLNDPRTDIDATNVNGKTAYEITYEHQPQFPIDQLMREMIDCALIKREQARQQRWCSLL
jgi:hypothetical protein